MSLLINFAALRSAHLSRRGHALRPPLSGDTIKQQWDFSYNLMMQPAALTLGEMTSGCSRRPRIGLAHGKPDDQPLDKK